MARQRWIGRLAATFFAGGGLLALATLPLTLDQPDASGRVQQVSRLPIGSLAAGTYDLRVVLSDAIGDLPERQQFVLACRYREDLRLGEIGEVMGVSESRVSQLHTKALISLRAVLGAARDPGLLRLAHS